ncbi:MAG: cellulose synthase operon protein YhjQ/BcsQ [Dokdonella sp.]
MRILGVVSMKGGVGKTTLSANLAESFAVHMRARVSVIDMDPQNGLIWHFTGKGGWPWLSQAILHDGTLGSGWQEPESGLALFPFGIPSEVQRVAVEDFLEQHPGWLGEQLRSEQFADRDLIVIDTPPGHSVYQQQVFACADQILMVLNPDLASLATVGDMETALELAMQQQPNLTNHYLLNQVDASHPIAANIGQFLKSRFGPRVLPVMVRSDDSLSEALAFHQPLRQYDAHGAALPDFDNLSSYLAELLDL